MSNLKGKKRHREVSSLWCQLHYYIQDWAGSQYPFRFFPFNFPFNNSFYFSKITVFDNWKLVIHLVCTSDGQCCGKKKCCVPPAVVREGDISHCFNSVAYPIGYVRFFPTNEIFNLGNLLGNQLLRSEKILSNYS